METQSLAISIYSKYLTFFCKITPPPFLNFDPDDFKGTGHKFNFCFKCCIFADNRFFSLFSPLFSSLSCSSNGIYFRILFKSLWKQLYEFIMLKNTKKFKHLFQSVLLFYSFNGNDQFRPKSP